jgi:truncated hemoglobin YjbI
MQPSTYERIGSAHSDKPAVDLFYEKVWVYEKVCADPALASHLSSIDRARLKAHQRAFMTSTLRMPGRHTAAMTNEG